MSKFDYRKIVVCRNKKGLSQERAILGLSKEGLDISRQTLINWENGETSPNVEQLACLAMFFDKPVAYFFKFRMKRSASLIDHVKRQK